MYNYINFKDSFIHLGVTVAMTIGNILKKVLQLLSHCKFWQLYKVTYFCMKGGKAGLAGFIGGLAGLAGLIDPLGRDLYAWLPWYGLAKSSDVCWVKLFTIES